MSTNQNTFEVLPANPLETLDIPQNRPISGFQDEKGRFLPGNCANPGGRPKIRHIREAMVARLETDGAEAVANIPFEVGLGAKSKPSEKLAAFEAIRDTVEGKPTQQILMGHTFDPASLDRLSTMLDKLNAPMLAEDNDD